MTDAIEITVGRGRLIAVPAVHFRVAFAERVNELCRQLRPTAVAVELGPQTASAAARWLKELGVNKDGSVRDLPCMLGLVKPNRYIRASARELALRMQEETGRNLHELPPEMLKKLLGYSAMRVLYLSPTDSIIEAMRCSLELGLPLYGVDLEDCAERQPCEKMIQDPTFAWGREDEYVRSNADFADGLRDDEIDGRRELAMAARLKTLLAKHERVLFTCGLAHWKQLARLLRDANIRPAPVSEVWDIEPQEFQRVVVHPHLAIYHMDLFPAFADFYQNERKRANEVVRSRKRHSIAPAEMFAEMLQSAYETHFVADRREAASLDPADDVPVWLPQDDAAQANKEQLNRRLEDWEAWRDFEKLLTHLCQVKQILVPDLLTALMVGQGTMSADFCRTLSDILMRFDWASPNDFEDLRILSPAPSESGEFIRAELSDKEGRHGRYFYIDPLPGRSGGSYRVQVPIPGSWSEKKEHIDRDDCGPTRSWNPRDYLKTAMSARAIEVAKGNRQKPRTVPFEGSMMDGFDLKATMRAYIRGDNRSFFVRDAGRPKIRKAMSESDGFPVVWILQPHQADAMNWRVSGEVLSSFQKYMADDDLCQRMLRQRGKYLVGFIEYSAERPDPDPQVSFERRVLNGMMMYQPPHFEYEQYGKWAENTRFARNPVIEHGFFEEVRSHFLGGRYLAHERETFTPFDPLAYDWPTALVLMAIPYSAGVVTVVTPDQFTLPRVVTEYAARHGVQINQAPLSYFPKEEVVKMSTDYFVPSLKGGDGNQFPEAVERILGEKQTAYRDLVPPKWLAYGK